MTAMKMAVMWTNVAGGGCISREGIRRVGLTPLDTLSKPSGYDRTVKEPRTK